MRHRPTRAGGFAAATALFAISLFVLIGVAAANIAHDNARAQQFHAIREQMVAQRDLIFNLILLCRTIYPAGNNGTGNHVQYPATPADRQVAALTCPGQGFAPIWSGDARAMAPRPLPGFNGWTYVNDSNSIRIQTTAVNPDSNWHRDLLDAVVARIGPGQAVRSGNALTLTLIN
ncbi:hypothetical protein RCH09_002338 [Actimicrobium sp. GrIS 1.19]|uniref:hypothetical protein n=1 Tax=Actimicrobium sp. GrIS 1.19 TaxID=3071708 RepID=UPI002DFD483C|nr:hypothetical protein [Actimicrobium sp. GrIS 1.19]